METITMLVAFYALFLHWVIVIGIIWALKQ